MRFITTSRNGQPLTQLIEPVESGAHGPTLSGLSSAYGATVLGMNRPTPGNYNHSGVLTIEAPESLDTIDRIVRFVTLVGGLIERKIEPDAAVDYAFDLMEAGDKL